MEGLKFFILKLNSQISPLTLHLTMLMHSLLADGNSEALETLTPEPEVENPENSETNQIRLLK